MHRQKELVSPLFGRNLCGTGRSTKLTIAFEPANSNSRGAASAPDFSGIWGHLTWPDVEPPAGPGPVRNTARRNGVSDIYKLVGDYTNPILKPRAVQEVKRYGELGLSGRPAPTPSNQCWPGGVNAEISASR